MEDRIAFECFHFDDKKDITINDVDFLVDRILMLPKLHPHSLDKAVKLTVDFCQYEAYL